MSYETIVLATAAAVIVSILIVIVHAAKYQIERHKQVENQRRVEEIRAKRINYDEYKH